MLLNTILLNHPGLWVRSQNTSVFRRLLCSISSNSKGKEDPEFVLARHLAVNLDKNGTSILEYAGGIRVSKLFEEYGIAQEEVKK